MTQKKIVDARADSNGNIIQVKLEGNTNYTSVDKAIEMADRGQIKNAHSVKKSDGSKYLRTNPDSQTGNNLDEMAES